MKYYLVISTIDSRERAKEIAKKLVEERLAACVNISADVVSIYRWKGNIEEDNEYMMFIKTTENKLDYLIDRLKSLHSYTVPEIMSLEIKKGYKGYLAWLEESC